MSQTFKTTEKSLKELRQDAEHALKRVRDHYLLPLGRTYPANTIWRHFHFVEEKRWTFYLRHIAYFNVPENRVASVEAVTHSYGNGPKIGINKYYHTYATLVHECIHFFSHHAFRKAFNVAQFEGATEYLTRALLADFGPRRDMYGQGDIYAEELALMKSIITDDGDNQRLCKAYFEGDQQSIAGIKQATTATG